MKAQSLRRTIWFLDAVLVLALVGTGAWWFLKIRPASADPGKARPKWVEASWKAYDERVKTITPTPIYPVDEKALTKVTRPDLKALGVGAYVGPMPPEPRAPTPAAPPPEIPKGLEAIGRPSSVIYVPPGDPAASSVVWWVFNSKKARPFPVGAFVRETDAEKGIFRIKAVNRPDPAKRIYEIVYDVHDPATEKVTQADQKSTFDLTEKPLDREVIHVGPTGPPGSAPGKPGPAVDPNRPLPTSVATGVLRAGSVTMTPTSLNNYDVGLERDAYDMLFRGNAENLLADLKTDVATDEAGQPKGLRLTGPAPGSLASQFNIQPGDILISINGQRVHSRSEAINVVKGIPKGVQSVVVVIERNARQITYDIDPRDPEVRKAAPRVKFRPGGN